MDLPSMSSKYNYSKCQGGHTPLGRLDSKRLLTTMQMLATYSKSLIRMKMVRCQATNSKLSETGLVSFMTFALVFTKAAPKWFGANSTKDSLQMEMNRLILTIEAFSKLVCSKSSVKICRDTDSREMFSIVGAKKVGNQPMKMSKFWLMRCSRLHAKSVRESFHQEKVFG